MQISRKEFDELMTAPTYHYSDFPNQDRYYQVFKHLQKMYEKLSGKRFRVY